MKNIKILLATFYTPGIYALEYLFESGFIPSQIAILTHQNERNLSLLEYASIHGIETVTYSAKSEEALLWVRTISPDAIFSLYYREIIPRDILNIPRLGSVNLHPSLLPKYRGAFSSPWTIFNGDKETGFTYHYMTEDVDAGNILLQKILAVRENDTAFSLYHRLIREGVSLFGLVLDMVLSGEKGSTQTGEPSYYPRAVPNKGIIDDDWAPERIERFIRAMFFPPFKGAVVIRNGKEVEVRSVHQYKKVTPPIDAENS
jgi:methionyl-tRNA formyltransferase